MKVDHKASLVRLDMFRRVMSQQQPTVLQQLQDKTGQQAEENKKKLLSIISTIEVCGQKDIPLRGHRNEDWNPAADDRPDSNPGNFLTLLRFRCEAGDDQSNVTSTSFLAVAGK